MSDSRWRPLQLGIGVVLLSATLYLYLGRTGWEPSSIGSQSMWCEYPRAGLLRERSNALSSLAYVVVGLYILQLMVNCRGRGENPLLERSYATGVYAAAAVLIGLGSFAMHGSNTRLGVYADTSAMMLFFSFPALYTYGRLRGWSDARFGMMALLVNSLLIGGQVLPHWGDFIRTWMLGVWLALEVALRYRDRGVLIFLVPTICDAVLAPIGTELYVRIALYAILALLFSRMEFIEIRRRASPWLVLGILSYLSAHVFWKLGVEQRAFCDPQSWFQGHAVWHVLSALAMLFFFWYFASETSPALEDE